MSKKLLFISAYHGLIFLVSASLQSKKSLSYADWAYDQDFAKSMASTSGGRNIPFLHPQNLPKWHKGDKDWVSHTFFSHHGPDDDAKGIDITSWLSEWGNSDGDPSIKPFELSKIPVLKALVQDFNLAVHHPWNAEWHERIGKQVDTLLQQIFVLVPQNQPLSPGVKDVLAQCLGGLAFATRAGCKDSERVTKANEHARELLQAQTQDTLQTHLARIYELELFFKRLYNLFQKPMSL